MPNMDVQELTVREAEDMAAQWGWWAAERDRVVLTALRSRVSKRRIAELTGLARTTIDAIESRNGAGS